MKKRTKVILMGDALAVMAFTAFYLSMPIRGGEFFLACMVGPVAISLIWTAIIYAVFNKDMNVSRAK